MAVDCLCKILHDLPISFLIVLVDEIHNTRSPKGCVDAWEEPLKVKRENITVSRIVLADLSQILFEPIRGTKTTFPYTTRVGIFALVCLEYRQSLLHENCLCHTVAEIGCKKLSPFRL